MPTKKERPPPDSSVFSLDSIALRHGKVALASYDLAPHSARASARKLDFYKWSDHDLQDAPLTRQPTAEFIEGLLAGGRSYCTVNETQNTTLFEALKKDVDLTTGLAMAEMQSAESADGADSED